MHIRSCVVQVIHIECKLKVSLSILVFVSSDRGKTYRNRFSCLPLKLGRKPSSVFFVARFLNRGSRMLAHCNKFLGWRSSWEITCLTLSHGRSELDQALFSFSCRVPSSNHINRSAVLSSDHCFLRLKLFCDTNEGQPKCWHLWRPRPCSVLLTKWTESGI